ncbi:MAG: response regulator transcription factor [Gemmatimonadetes bacterium]|nr:response regulator transcription factor [Gemmatimonadota bacterium]
MVKRLLIADSAELSRKSLVELIRTQPDCCVVADVGTIEATLTACATEPHDLLIADTHTRSAASGFAGPDARPEFIVDEVLDRRPDERLIALVADARQQCLLNPEEGSRKLPPVPCCGSRDCPGALFVRGVRCVLSRNARPAALFYAIRRVSGHRSCFSADFSQRVVTCASRHRGALRNLSPRECQVAARVAGGLCNKEIAAELGIGVAAVKKHIGHLLRKLDVQDRLQLGLLIARRPDLTTPEV